MRNLCLVLLTLAALPACNIYWGDGDDCLDNGDIAFAGLRNPETGACESYGGGGSGCYQPQAGAETAGDRAPLPDWGECPSACETACGSRCPSPSESGLHCSVSPGSPISCESMSPSRSQSAWILRTRSLPPSTR